MFASAVQGTKSTNKANYNNGKQSTAMRVNVNYTLDSNLDAGVPQSINIFHSFISGVNIIENVQAEMQSDNGKITCYAVASNIEANGLIRVWVTNISNSVITAGNTIRFTVNLISNV